MYLLLNTTSTNVVTAIEERLKHEYKHSGEDRRRIASSDKIDIHIGSNGVPVSNGKDCLWIDDTEQQREHEREDAGYEDGMVVVAVHHRCTSKLAMPASRTEKHVPSLGMSFPDAAVKRRYAARMARCRALTSVEREVLLLVSCETEPTNQKFFNLSFMCCAGLVRARDCGTSVAGKNIELPLLEQIDIWDVYFGADSSVVDATPCRVGCCSS